MISDRHQMTHQQFVRDFMVRGTANTALCTDYFDWKAIDVNYVAHLLPSALDMAFGPRRVGVGAWDISKLPLRRKRMSRMLCSSVKPSNDPFSATGLKPNLKRSRSTTNQNRMYYIY